ncbi:MAG: hypothetical protein ABIG63_09140 [Chloroflexota bacterium]
MDTVEIAYHLQPIIEQLPGNTFNQKISGILSNEIRRYLAECEQELLDLEICYGLDYWEFKEKLAQGELGDEFSYPREEDAMRWEDLVKEKKHWLKQIRSVAKFDMP